MAISYDNSAAFISIPTGVHSFSYTVGSGKNRYLMVLGTGSFSGGTYNGIPLTLLINVTSPISDGNEQTVTVYGLANPPSGSNTLDISSGFDTAILVASYDGVFQGTQPEDSNQSFPNDGSHNVQTTTLALSIGALTDGAWGIYFNINSAGLKTMTAAQGTLRKSNISDARTGGAAIIDSNGPLNEGDSWTGEATLSSGTAFMGAVTFSLKAEPGFIPQVTIL